MCAVSSVVRSNDKIKTLFTTWNLGSIGTCIVTFDWYLFQLIILLKTDFNYCNSIALSWYDIATNGTKNFVSVTASVLFCIIR